MQVSDVYKRSVTVSLSDYTTVGQSRLSSLRLSSEQSIISLIEGEDGIGGFLPNDRLLPRIPDKGSCQNGNGMFSFKRCEKPMDGRTKQGRRREYV